MEGQTGRCAGVSVGSTGICLAHPHLRNVLACLVMPTLGQPEVFLHAKEGLFDGEGNLSDHPSKFLQGWTDRCFSWVKLHA